VEESPSQAAASNGDSQGDEISTQVRSQQDTINTLTMTNKSLIENYNMVNNRLQAEQDSNVALREELRTARSNQSSWLGRPSVSAHEYDRVVHELQRVKGELDNAKLKDREHRESMERLRKEISLVTQKVNLYESEAQRAQEHSFKSMSEARWTPRDDSTFTNQFNELQRLIRNWAKDYAAATLRSDALHPDTHNEILKYLSRVVHLAINGTLPTEFASPTSKMSGKWPYMLLSAVLAHEIQNEFFKRPFFCLERDPSNGSESSISTLVAVYDQLLEGMRHSSHVIELSIY
jgi:hypothetical protein